MRIAVRLGSGLSRLAGGPRLDVELDDGTTVEDLLCRVAADRPVLSDGLPSVLTVVRGSQVAGDRVLADGDEVALLIPIAGGSDDPRKAASKGDSDGG
jgi:molybdopterin converting factor small subunit